MTSVGVLGTEGEACSQLCSCGGRSAFRASSPSSGFKSNASGSVLVPQGVAKRVDVARGRWGTFLAPRPRGDCPAPPASSWHQSREGVGRGRAAQATAIVPRPGTACRPPRCPLFLRLSLDRKRDNRGGPRWPEERWELDRGGGGTEGRGLTGDRERGSGWADRWTGGQTGDR